ncbi:MAG TPA: hypothetical protein VMV86_06785 [Methanosarcinales archaeon]|nr:hypothetical protein [Methanosarcinales archaeon]
MAYETGTATSPNNLLEKLKDFLVNDDGWTLDSFTDDTYRYYPTGAGSAGKRLHVHKTPSSAGSGDPDMYFNFRSTAGLDLITEDGETNTYLTGYRGSVQGIAVNGSTGYDAGENWDQQPGYAVDQSADSFAMCINGLSLSSIPAYHFFADGDTVVVVVEFQTGKFQFLSFGCVEKQGTYTGGHFFSGSFSSAYAYYYQNDVSIDNYGPYFFAAGVSSITGAVYYDADGSAEWRICGGAYYTNIFPCPSGQTSNGPYSRRGLCGAFLTSAPNSYNTIATLCPIYILGPRTSTNRSLLGHPKSIRFLNQSLYTAAQEITYGGDTWIVFNTISHNNATALSYLNTGCGFAVKKVV